MKKSLLIILLCTIQNLFAGPQYTDIQNSIITVDFSKLGYKTIITNGKTNEWKGTLPTNKNIETYSVNEYIWYDAISDDVGDGDYLYPTNIEFGDHDADIKQFRVCHDSSNVYFYLQTYNTNNKVFRSCAVIGIEAGTPDTGSYDFVEGDGVHPELGPAAELRSTKVKCDYFIFSELNKYWGTWRTEKSHVSAEKVREGYYSFKMIVPQDEGSTEGGNIQIFPESSITVDMIKITNFKMWVYDTGGNNTLELTLVDSSGRVEKRWSDKDTTVSNKTIFNTWAHVILPLTNFNFVDLTKISKVEIYLRWPGVYYFDDFRYGTNSYHTFDKVSNTCKMWDANGALNKVSCQPYGMNQWGIKIPKSLIGDPSSKQWQFIVGIGFNVSHMFREIQPADVPGAWWREWYGPNGDSSWWDHTGPDPDVYDLIGASVENQILDLSKYQKIFTTANSNLENLNVNIAPNPFNPGKGKILISVSVPIKVHMKIKILSLDGNEVKNLLDKDITPPYASYVYEQEWDGKDNNNNVLKSGAYIVSIKYQSSTGSRSRFKYIKVYR